MRSGSFAVRAAAAFVTSAVVGAAVIIIGHGLASGGSPVLTDANGDPATVEFSTAAPDDLLPEIGSGVGRPEQSGTVPSVDAEPLPVITATPVDPADDTDDAVVTRRGESTTIASGDAPATRDTAHDDPTTTDRGPATDEGPPTAQAGPAPERDRIADASGGTPSGATSGAASRPSGPAQEAATGAGSGGAGASAEDPGGQDEPDPTPSPTPTAEPSEAATASDTDKSSEAPTES